MEQHEVVPDVVDVVPPEVVEVSYGDHKVQLGNELTPTQVKDTPTVHWNAESKALYTLVMTDPDAPSRKNPLMREILHWMVVNVPENNVSQGETVSPYIGSGPPKDSGLHRYVFFVYKQPGKLTCDEPNTPNWSTEGRRKFSLRKFAEKYNLGQPVAGNFYQAQWDEYVQKLYEKMGRK